QPRNWAQLLLHMLSRSSNLPDGHAALWLRRAPRLETLAELHSQPANWRHDRYRLSFSLQHRRLLDSRGSRPWHTGYRYRAGFHRKLRSIALFPRMVTRYRRLAAFQRPDERTCSDLPGEPHRRSHVA